MSRENGHSPVMGIIFIIITAGVGSLGYFLGEPMWYLIFGITAFLIWFEIALHNAPPDAPWD